MLIGQHSTAQRSVSCPCLPQRRQIAAAAACLTIGNGPTGSNSRAQRKSTFCCCRFLPAACQTGPVYGCCGGVSFHVLPQSTPPPPGCHIGLCVLFQVRDPDPGAMVMSVVTAELRAELRAWARCARAARGGGSWPSLPEGSGWTTAMAGGRPALCLRVNFLRFVWGGGGEAACS